jgi:hypothetical protein
VCWRDSLSDHDRRQLYQSERDEIHRARTLVTVEARKNDDVNTDTYRRGESLRRYFRRSTWRTLAGPIDTTELKFKAGTVVVVTKLPEEVRKKFGLRARDIAENQSNLLKRKVGGPKATVVIVRGETGLSFGTTGKKLYFPLRGDDYVTFRVLSIPRM